MAISPRTSSARWTVAWPVLRTPGEVARDETIAELRKQLRASKSEITELNGKLDALATVTVNLYSENQSLRMRIGAIVQAVHALVTCTYSG
ncbi:hypothetical protein ABZX85_50320 [Streptomyces sp. NPDC004539]|uniref:hypothetical protein n=1 Tax=Streptomyces sp. NPDC004539 TaxID=3154280 RepID=UPI0033A720AD